MMMNNLINGFFLIIAVMVVSPVLIILPFVLLYKLEQYCYNTFKEITRDI